MRIVTLFLKAHREALRAAWPFDYPLVSGKRSLDGRQDKHASQRGQIVFEFILLMVISITIATMVSKKMVSRDPGDPGFLTGAWARMSQAIGSDIVD